MQLSDLVKPLDQLTDDELRERLREIRHNRSVIRPAAQKLKEAPAKKEAKARASKANSKVDKLLQGMTPEQIQQLLLSLGDE